MNLFSNFIFFLQNLIILSCNLIAFSSIGFSYAMMGRRVTGFEMYNASWSTVQADRLDEILTSSPDEDPNPTEGPDQDA